MALYNNIEKIAPKLIAKQRQLFKGVSPNIDFYSGFVMFAHTRNNVEFVNMVKKNHFI